MINFWNRITRRFRPVKEVTIETSGGVTIGSSIEDRRGEMTQEVHDDLKLDSNIRAADNYPNNEVK